MRLLPLIFITCLLSACTSTKDTSTIKNKTPDKSVGKDIVEISAPIVKKPFVNKAGKELDFSEYYVQRSIQDYFIKFCESSVTSDEIDAALAKQSGLVKSLTLQVEIRDGNWDICPQDPQEMQSRIGEYMVIHKIVE